MMTKDEAEREAIRRFGQLPYHERQQYEDAEAYAQRLELELDFPTITSKKKLIAAWLIREMSRARLRGDDAREAAEVVVFVEDAAVDIAETTDAAA